MEKLEVIYKDIKDIKPYENNPRDNSKAIEQVMKSIEEFGFKVPIVINKDGTIVTGHTRYEACKRLGLKEIPCIIADDLNEKQIKAFRIADNKVTDYSIWDNSKLLEELQSLDDIFTGFEISELFGGEELDEKDNDFLDDVIETSGEAKYTINYSCKTAEEYYDIMNYIESVKSKYE